MDIEKLLQQATQYLEEAIEPDPNRNRLLPAQIATACASLAHAMIEYERWQEERFKAERDELLAQRKDDSPF